MVFLGTLGRILGGLSALLPHQNATTTSNTNTTDLFTVPLPLDISQPVPDPTVVQTSSGKLHGLKLSNLTSAYLGIPYAGPPLGQLRFAPPVALLTPDEDRVVTAYGPSCYQSPARSLVPSPTGENEDCLTINVFAPNPELVKKQRKGLPTFLWVYGGSFNKWNSAMPAYNLARLANAHPDVIFVSFNYRLNALGFPFSPALESLNAGLRDQRLAVEWVYNNIEAFGGDPDRIVMGGESVGASSVAAYLYSFKNETLLNGAFTMSGTEKLISNGLIGPFDPKPNHTDSFQAFANGAGCQLQGEDFAGQLNCLREADTEAIYKGVIQDKVKKLAPHYDEELVFTTDEYARKAVSGDFARIPLLTGTTNDEGDNFVLSTTVSNSSNVFTGNSNETIYRSLNKYRSLLTSLYAFTCYDRDFAKSRAAHNVTTYRYRYMPAFPAVSVPPLRAYHTSDIFTLFGTFESRLDENAPHGPPPTDKELKASEYMMQVYTDFVRDPENGLAKLGWKKYNPHEETLNKMFENEYVEEPLSFAKPEEYDNKCYLVGM